MSATADPLELTPTQAAHLDLAINGLRNDTPHLSADQTLTRRQRLGSIPMVVVLLACLVVSPRWTAVALLTLVNVGYASIVAYRAHLFARGLRSTAKITVTDDEALAVPDEDLPPYTVLLPAYHEMDIVADLVRGVGRLDYPADKLDVRLLLEADDTMTIGAAEAAEGGSLGTIIAVPPAEPRTKPKACNYGLIGAPGEYVTIYDAEDIPDPLQLRRAVVAFRRSPPEVACLQARLAYFNDDQNLITRWFGIEYATWFSNMLPGLADVGAPIPLGGTSNHLRADVLREIGAWDAFNVTEDADLGVRLARRGYRCGVLDSETLEEANSDYINWAKQRSRWYKGYLQTALIHLRHPRALLRELGPKNTLSFLLVMFGTPLLSVLNPLAWALTIAWWLGTPTVIASVFPSWLYYPSLLSLVVGNFTTIYMHLVIARESGRRHLALCCLVLPGYWVMMAVAAVKAFVQLVTAPSYWEKTTHGLHRPT